MSDHFTTLWSKAIFVLSFNVSCVKKITKKYYLNINSCYFSIRKLFERGGKLLICGWATKFLFKIFQVDFSVYKPDLINCNQITQLTKFSNESYYSWKWFTKWFSNEFYLQYLDHSEVYSTGWKMVQNGKEHSEDSFITYFSAIWIFWTKDEL